MTWPPLPFTQFRAHELTTFVAFCPWIKKKKEEEGSHALIRTMYKLSQILVNFFFFFKDYFIFLLIYLF